MKIVSAELYRYHLDMVHRVTVGHVAVSKRVGLILKLTADNGAMGLGEIAPLPGFSREQLSSAVRDALRFARTVVGQSVDCVLGAGWGPVFLFAQWLETVTGKSVVSSVRCGVDMALLNLDAASMSISPAQLLFEKPRRRVLVNGLLDRGDREVAKTARRMAQEGYKAVKLKVGQDPFADDVEKVHAVREAIGNRVALRLDANRSWGLRAAVAFARAVADCEIDYIEEPLRDPHRLPDFFERTGIPFALDETINRQVFLKHTSSDRTYSRKSTTMNDRTLFELLRILSAAKAVIAKPTVACGLRPLAAPSLTGARRKPARCLSIVSSCFESGLGVAALANVAAGLNDVEVPMGLDVYRWLAEDILEERLAINHGQLDLAQVNAAAAKVDLGRLQKVE